MRRRQSALARRRLGVRFEIEFRRPKPLRAARRKPGQGSPPLQRFFQCERRPAGGQCANRVPAESGRGPRLRVQVAQALACEFLIVLAGEKVKKTQAEACAT